MTYRIGMAIAVALAFATLSSATPVSLTLIQETGKVYQQTTNSPCIFGYSSCNNPAGFPFVNDTATGGGMNTTVTGDIVYAASLINQVAPGYTFLIGIDVNQNDHPQTLYSFTVDVNGNIVYAFSNTVDNGNIATVNNGNGWADYILATGQTAGIPTPISLFIANPSSDSVSFHFSAGLNDGGDQFFLIPAQSRDVGGVPEPSNFGLMGSAMLAAGLLARRKRA